MKSKKVLSILTILILLVVASWFYASKTVEKSQESVNQTTGKVITDCDVKPTQKQGIDWEYINPEATKRPTADCKAIRFLRASN